MLHNPSFERSFAIMPANPAQLRRSASLNLPMHIDSGSSLRVDIVNLRLAPARGACNVFSRHFSAERNHGSRVQVFGWVWAADYRSNPSRRELLANCIRHVAQRAGPPARNLPAHNHWCHTLVWRAVARPKLPRPCYRFSNHHLPFQKSALATRRTHHSSGLRARNARSR